MNMSTVSLPSPDQSLCYGLPGNGHSFLAATLPGKHPIHLDTVQRVAKVDLSPG